MVYYNYFFFYHGIHRWDSYLRDIIEQSNCLVLINKLVQSDSEVNVKEVSRCQQL